MKVESIRRDPIPVHINHKLSESIPGYLLDRRQDVSTMLAALALSDFETLVRLGHNMHGAGASFGFQAITDIGAALELHAAISNFDESRKWVAELSNYLDRVEFARTKSPSSGTDFNVKNPRSFNLDANSELRINEILTVSAVRRIVLVEDHEPSRAMLCEFFGIIGHLVWEARDGIEGLAMILAEKPDVAFIDISLPGIMDGYEVARRVRAELGSSIQLIAMTGYGEPNDRLKAFAAGFDTHMVKPVDLDLVEGMLQNKGSTSDLHIV